MPAPPLGAHVSIAGGLHLAIERAVDLGCDAIQIFVKNASQWQGKPLTDEAADHFRKARAESGIGPLVAHSTYLLNLAAIDPGNLERSRRALADELNRCHRLGVEGLVLHPGAHLGAGEEAGIQRIVESLDFVLSQAPEEDPRVLLELTAGQGTVLGYRLEQLEQIRNRASFRRRIGICIDTCHAFAAGYPLHDRSGYRDFWDEAQERLGLGRIGCIHLNDSQRSHGSRRDRHANLGEGEIGLKLFRRMLRDPRLAEIPMILETPLGEDGEGHRRDLEKLRRIRARKRVS